MKKNCRGKKMKLYIAMHGQTINNALSYHSLESDDLTDRTRHTAEIININNNKIVYDDRIKERDPANLGGKSRENENRDEYWNYFTTIQYGTSENIKEFFNRVYNFLDELKTKDYKSVLIVAHSGVSKAFSGYFDGIQDGKFLKRGLKNCEIKEYEL